MDTFTKSIKENTNISPILINNIALTNMIAYADDVAIIVQNKAEIQVTLSAYEKFSEQPGLYINVENHI